MISIGRLGGSRGQRSFRRAGGGGAVGAVLDYLEKEGLGPRMAYFRSEDKGRWFGQLAEQVALRGTVVREDLRDILEGRDPRDGEMLRSAAVQRFALDFTLSVPKSVSLVWALGDDATAAAVIDAVEHANEVALGFLEREAVGVRRGLARRGRPCASVTQSGCRSEAHHTKHLTSAAVGYRQPSERVRSRPASFVAPALPREPTTSPTAIGGLLRSAAIWVTTCPRSSP